MNIKKSYESYQLANNKWVPKVKVREYLPDKVLEQSYSWDEHFDTKKEADAFARTKAKNTNLENQ
ncbi:hypothetical protein KC867_02400 [Candidatus Saccharibacteria bacterium]|nr:hypothetical protein [Candidatus Saccharibacteria bacterium]